MKSFSDILSNIFGSKTYTSDSSRGREVIQSRPNIIQKFRQAVDPNYVFGLERGGSQPVNATPRSLDEVKNIATPTPSPQPTITPPPDRSALPYYKQINETSQKNDIPEHILYRLLKKESMNFNPKVVSGEINSPVGAQGIAQFMPSTAEMMGIDPLDPTQAIPASGEYLRQQYDSFGSWPEALAGYNAGPGAVRLHGGVPPFDETQNYVKTILQDLGL